MQSALRYPLVTVVLLGLAACVLPGMEPPIPSGAEDYATYCAVCHGDGGKGAGPMASTLEARPADLTLLSDRNGGTFPTTRVMAKVWGYTGARANDGIMPNFGPLLAGNTVLYDGGDGIDTPTPIRLVQIAEYVKTLQK